MRNKIIIGCLLLGALSAKAQDARLSAVEYKERVLEYSRQIKQSSEEPFGGLLRQLSVPYQ